MDSSLAWSHYKLNVATGSLLAAAAGSMIFGGGTFFPTATVALPPTPAPAAAQPSFVSTAQSCGPCIPYLNETLMQARRATIAPPLSIPILRPARPKLACLASGS